MKRTTVLIAVLCLLAVGAPGKAASENTDAGVQSAATDAPQAAADLQSTLSGRQSPFIGNEAITIPQVLSYQGRLTDSLGMPVADTVYSVEFRLYNAPSGGSPFWNETQSVRTRGGLFSILLGSVTPVGSVPDAGAAYLGMAVAGGAELAPRLRLASAAYT